jgi:UTP--glucose-1-phosphate uridylyltransferase
MGKDYLPLFKEKMTRDGQPEVAVRTFDHYYRRLVDSLEGPGAAAGFGKIFEKDIEPVAPESLVAADALSAYAAAGEKMMPKAVMIVLNGGLGTSMGLAGPKSLITVKDGQSFLEIILKQADRRNVRLAFMNSFNTHDQTLAAVSRIQPETAPMFFLQHRFPKVVKDTLAPAVCPEHRELEWNPPGHGDIYTALKTSGTLEKLLAQGVAYAFIANADNLGASLEPALLGYFAENDLPFMMETARRTPADVKGGHLARHVDGRLLLRETAQCPDEEKQAFQDIERYRYFNTNNLWVDLNRLEGLFSARSMIKLPMILNKKHLDPRDDQSPEVYQIETAMGAAVELFDGAAAVEVPTTRFFPVKKCSDLMAVRSDCFRLTEAGRLVPNPLRKLGRINITLDSKYYGKIDEFDARFPDGVPSLVACESLNIEGDVAFEGDVTLMGKVTIRNHQSSQRIVKQGTVIAGNDA